MVTLRYFAWVRERIGRGEEKLDVPANVHTIAELATWLATRGPEYAAAFVKPDVVRAAIDHKQVKPDASISGAKEIAFFPPMTGG
jgi:sulfur-carrier protein